MTSQAKLWHPRLHPNALGKTGPFRIVGGEGVYVTAEDGERYIDGVSSLFNVFVGHNRPEIKQAITQQMDELSYYPIHAGVSHPRAEELSIRLAELLEPENMSNVMFGSCGSDAVEAALIISRQFWRISGQSGKTKFGSLRFSYHGSSFGGKSVTGSPGYRANYEPLLSDCFHIDAPFIYRNPYTNDPVKLAQACIDQAEREILFQGPESIASIIAEPIQTAGGLIVPPEDYWPKLRELCNRYDILLIADEVVTAFGRTGALFASRDMGVAPDIMCFAKGITSGYLPLGATVFNQRIAEAFITSDEKRGIIMYGNTYAAHPLCCAAALANIAIITGEKLADRAAILGNKLMDRIKPLEEMYAHVGEVRGRGLLVGIDLVEDKRSRKSVDPAKGYADALVAVAKSEGVLIRSLGKLLVIAPPLIISEDELDRICDALFKAFETVNPT